jgi:hypothetical protein
MKFLLLVLFLFSIEANAANRLLKRENIIDIGHNQESREIEVPKEKIVKEPNIQLIENRTVYAKRVESEKFDCETDFLGTETCTKQQTICPSNTEYTDGYSVVHHVSKKFVKQCPPDTLLYGNRCYLDENRDGLKDYYYYVKSGGYVWSNVPLSSSRNVNRSGRVTIPPRGYLEVRHYSPQACDDDNNHVVVKINNVSKIDTWCRRSRDTGNVVVYKNNTSSSVSVSYYYFDGHAGRGWDRSYFLQYIYGPNRVISKTGFIEEKVNGKVYLYTSTQCPNNTVEQADGSCIMEYDWYSYLCPNDLNEYGEPWRPINEGSDCGNVSCTNSQTPPVNNCARVHYTCPDNPGVKCGKTNNEIGFCEDGYVWNNSRCERVETFCGSSFYNATLDICQDITKYTKLCKGQGEVYDEKLNKCVSSVIACEDGVYSKEYNKCMMDFVGDCSLDGYVYNPISDICENKTKPICETLYNYDSSKAICIGEMAVCSTGYSYNEETNKCEKDVCDILNTSDSGTRCEAPSPCKGTITSDGKCIPTKIQ